jgi:hypothetical protein
MKTNLVASLTMEKCLYMAWPGTGFRPTGPIGGPGGEPAPLNCGPGFMALGPGGLFRRPCIGAGLADRPCPFGVIGR